MIPVDTRLNPDNWSVPLVVLIGVGMGKDDLAVNVLRWLQRAEVLAGGRRHLEWFADHPAEKIVLQSPLQQTVERLQSFSATRRVAVLASGDPFFFGIGRRLVRTLGKERVLTFPNITAVQALFARLGEPWDGVRVISLHGRQGREGEEDWIREVRLHPRTTLFSDPVHTPGWIARQLRAAGVINRTMVVGEDLGAATESLRCLSLEEAGREAFSPLNLVALFPVREPEAVSERTAGGARGAGRERGSCVLGLPEAAFRHEAGMITKMEVRAVVLALLQLEPGLVLWDLGAASGSVSIEASRLTPLGRVFSVEQHAGRFADLVENVRRFGCEEIQPVYGRAMEVIDGLPDPDRVFIGGSGGDLPKILGEASARLRPGGRVVQTAVTLETLEKARSFWARTDFEVSITQLQVNRSAPIGTTVRFEALNPVFVIAAWKAA